MANEKKSNGNKSGGSAGRSLVKAGGKNSAAVKNTGKTGGKGAKLEAVPESSGMIHQFMPYLLVILAVFLAACFILAKTDGPMGVVGMALRNFFCGLFGWPAYFIPLILINLAVYWRKYVDLQMVGWKLGLSHLTIISISSLVHGVWVTKTFPEAKYPLSLWARTVFGTSGETSNWAHGKALEGGGFFGGLAGGFIRSICGPVGSTIITIAAITICVMFFFSVTPAYVVTSVRSGFASLKERFAAAKAAAENDREEKSRRLAEKQAAREKAERQAAELAAEREANARKRAEEERARTRVRTAGPASGTPAAATAEIFNAGPDATGPRAADSGNSAARDRREAEAGAAVAAAALTVRPAGNTGSDGVPADMSAVPAGDVLPPETAGGTPAATRRGRGAASPADAGAAPATSIEILDDVLAGRRSRGGQTAAPAAAAAAAAAAGRESARSAAPDAAEPAGTLPKLEKIDDSGLSPDLTGAADAAAASSPNDTDAARRRAERLSVYFFPPTNLLAEPVAPGNTDIESELNENAQKLMNKLSAFNVKIKRIGYSRGPTITRYELYPEASTRVRSIASLADDIALELAATIRMEAPIPNKNAIGVEVPNQVRATVFIRELIESDKFRSMTGKLSACLGKDVGGNMVFFDIGKMPHLLIAGTTGSGKSVCLNCIILSLLYKARPDELQFIMIDPKKIEMGMYNGLPHLKVPVVTDMKRAAGTLNAAVNEMEHRYSLFEDIGARDIDGYNKFMAEDDPDFIPLPKIVIIIDELADLMMSTPAEIETSIIRLAQKARAAGIHLIIGTQRPSVNVITGLIKANIPSRIAFSVVSNVESRIIIDIAGAEKLIGKGDMLFAPIGAQKPLRIQGAFVADDEVRAVTTFIKQNCAEVEYDREFISDIDRETDRLTAEDSRGKGQQDDEPAEFNQEADKLFNQALHIAVENGTVATSLLQRKLSIGFGRGAKIIDRMEALGFVSGANGTKPRNVLISAAKLAELEAENSPSVQGRFV